MKYNIDLGLLFAEAHKLKVGRLSEDTFLFLDTVNSQYLHV